MVPTNQIRVLSPHQSQHSHKSSVQYNHGKSSWSSPNSYDPSPPTDSASAGQRHADESRNYPGQRQPTGTTAPASSEDGAGLCTDKGSAPSSASAGTGRSRREPSASPPKEGESLCAVCGDIAGGNFFGAIVCLPCKSFFIRCTKDGEPDIQKQCSGSCDISKHLRNRCQFCRFQRCIAMGMTRKDKPLVVLAGAGQELCRVCGDLANGVHFGVFTCEGCKKFFRRGLKEHELYVCRSSKDCQLNPRTRNNCRYCRFQRCLAAGMSREAIKMGRPRKIYSRSLFGGRESFMFTTSSDVTNGVTTPAVNNTSGESSQNVPTLDTRTPREIAAQNTSHFQQWRDPQACSPFTTVDHTRSVSTSSGYWRDTTRWNGCEDVTQSATSSPPASDAAAVARDIDPPSLHQPTDNTPSEGLTTALPGTGSFCEVSTLPDRTGDHIRQSLHEPVDSSDGYSPLACETTTMINLTTPTTMASTIPQQTNFPPPVSFEMTNTKASDPSRPMQMGNWKDHTPPLLDNPMITPSRKAAKTTSSSSTTEASSMFHRYRPDADFPGQDFSPVPCECCVSPYSSGRGQGSPNNQGSDRMQGSPYNQGSDRMQSSPYNQGSDRMQGSPYNQGSDRMQGSPYNQGSDRMQGSPYNQGSDRMQGSPYNQGSDRMQGSPYNQGVPEYCHTQCNRPTAQISSSENLGRSVVTENNRMPVIRSSPPALIRVSSYQMNDTVHANNHEVLDMCVDKTVTIPVDYRSRQGYCSERNCHCRNRDLTRSSCFCSGNLFHTNSAEMLDNVPEETTRGIKVPRRDESVVYDLSVRPLDLSCPSKLDTKKTPDQEQPDSDCVQGPNHMLPENCSNWRNTKPQQPELRTNGVIRNKRSSAGDVDPYVESRPDQLQLGRQEPRRQSQCIWPPHAATDPHQHSPTCLQRSLSLPNSGASCGRHFHVCPHCSQSQPHARMEISEQCNHSQPCSFHSHLKSRADFSEQTLRTCSSQSQVNSRPEFYERHELILRPHPPQSHQDSEAHLQGHSWPHPTHSQIHSRADADQHVWPCPSNAVPQSGVTVHANPHLPHAQLTLNNGHERPQFLHSSPVMSFEQHYHVTSQPSQHQRQSHGEQFLSGHNQTMPQPQSAERQFYSAHPSPGGPASGGHRGSFNPVLNEDIHKTNELFVSVATLMEVAEETGCNHWKIPTSRHNDNHAPGEIQLLEELMKAQYNFSPRSMVQYWNSLSSRLQSTAEGEEMPGKYREILGAMLKSYEELLKAIDHSQYEIEEKGCEWTKEEHAARRRWKKIQCRMVREAQACMKCAFQVPGIEAVPPNDRSRLVRREMLFPLGLLSASTTFFDPVKGAFKHLFEWEIGAYHPMAAFRQRLLALGRKIFAQDMDLSEVALLFALNVVCLESGHLQDLDMLETLLYDLLMTLATYVSCVRKMDPKSRLNNLFRLMPRMRLMGIWHSHLAKNLMFDIGLMENNIRNIHLSTEAGQHQQSTVTE